MVRRGILPLLLAGAVALSARGTLYQGLENTPLGAASLAVQGNQLIVSGIGSSGQDGVAIALPSTLAGLEAHWLNPDAGGTLPIGAYLRQQVIGPAGGTNGPLGMLMVRKAGANNYALSADFSAIGASTYTLKAYLQGALVAQASGVSGAALAQASSCTLSGDIEVSCCPWQLTVSVDWGSSPTSLFANGASVSCDHLFISPENVSLASAPTALQINGAQLGSLVLTAEDQSVVYGGLTNTAVGNASLTMQSNQVVVGHLSNIGADGVSITLPSGVSSLEAQWQDLEGSGPLPVGSAVYHQLLGTANGVTNGVLGTMVVAKNGPGNFVINADCSAIGGSTFTARAYLHGALVASASGLPGGDLAEATSCTVSADIDFGSDGSISFTFDWHLTATSLSLNGANVTCDHLFVTPENVVLNGRPTALQIIADGPPSITLTAEVLGLSYSGMVHTSVGSASLAVQGGQLNVGNLGSSGQDGVSIALPSNLTMLEAHWQNPDAAGTLPVGASLQEQLLGPGSTGTIGSQGMVQVTKTSLSNYVVSADFSALGASQCTVQAYRNGVLVAQVTTSSGAAVAEAASMNWSFDLEITCCPTEWNWTTDFGPGGTALTLSGGPTVTCDQLFITPAGVSFSSPPSAMQITSANVPALQFTSEDVGVSSGTVIYQNLQNSTLGSASLSVQSNQLTVANIGSSGQDGVEIALPSGLSGLETHWQSLELSNSLPVGAFVRQQVMGSIGGGSNGPLGSLTVTKAGSGNYSISADFSAIGATTYTVQAYRQGVLVAQASGLSGAALARASSFGLSGDLELSCCPWTLTISADWGSSATSLALNGANVTCDHLFITPESVVLAQPPTAFQIMAAQVSGITITAENEVVSYDGLSNSSLGHASLAVQGNQLTVANIGSSGQDGVAIALPSTLTGVQVHWDNPEPSGALPVGAYLRQTLIGASNTPVGSLTLRKAGANNYPISANFSALGASTYTIEAYRQGVVVAQASGLNGATLATASSMGWSCDFGYECCPYKWVLSLDWGSSATSLFVNGANVNCDHLLVTPENVSSASGPTVLQITGSQLGSLNINAENQTVLYGGLANTALGNGGLTVQSNQLTLFNLGSSGQDGVSIALPTGLASLAAHWQDLEGSGPLPVGAVVREQLIGTANGVTGGVLGTLALTKAGSSNFVLSADCSPMGAQTYTVQAYLNGALVGQASGLNGLALAQASSDGAGWDIEVSCCPLSIRLTFHWDSSPTSLSLNGANLTCDHVFVTPENVSLSAQPTALQMTAAGVPAITFTAENLGLPYNGLVHTSVGNATLALQGSQLNVGNLGSSGQDGVEIALPSGLSLLEAHWQNPDAAGTLPVGASLQEQVLGPGSTGAVSSQGMVQVTKASSSNYVISADFSPLGVTTCTLQAYRNGVLVGQVTTPTGAAMAVASSMNWSFDIGFSCCPAVWSWSTDYGPFATSLTLSGGPTVTCDQLVVTPQGAFFSGAPSAVQIKGVNVGALQFTSEDVGVGSGTVTYQNLQNSSLGSATLSVQSNQVTVANIGSSGQDGVEIALPGGLTGLETHWNNPDAGGTLPAGASVREQVIGSANTISNGPLGSVTLTKAGPGNYAIGADFSAVGVSTYSVQAFNQGVLVAQASGLPGAALARASSFSLSGDVEISCCPWELTISVDWGSSGTSLALAGANVACDHLFIKPEGLTLVSAPSALQITAANLPALTLSAENQSLAYGGLSNSSLGSATLAVQGSQLLLGILGSSGEDGVSIALPANLTALEVHWDNPDAAGTLPVGAYVRQQVIGSTAGITNGPLGSLTLRKAGDSNYPISADFSAIGASTYTVKAYRQGVLVAQASGLNGASLAQASNFHLSGDLELSCCPWELTISVDWGNSPSNVRLNGANVTCDHLFITPEHVSLPSAPTAFQITASGLTSLAIESENPTMLYGGVASTALGNANLAVQTNQLTLLNLGSSGQDGVSLAIPSSLSALEAHWQNLESSSPLPIGAALREQVIGSANGITNGVVGTLAITKAGTSNFVLSADASPIGAQTYTVQAYLQGALVGQASGLSGQGLAQASSMSFSWDIEISCCPFRIAYTIGWGGSPTSLVLNGANLVCDHVYVTPQGGSLSSAPAALQLTVSDVPSLTLSSLSVSPLELGLTRAPSTLTLQWLGTGTLQQSTDLKSWQDQPSATSPYTVPLGPTNQFFRMKQPVQN